MHQEAYSKNPIFDFHLLEDECVGLEFDQSRSRMPIPLLTVPDFCWAVVVDEVPVHHRLVVFADRGSISTQRKPQLPVGLRKHQEVCPRPED
jgi:hypothetical protein